LKLSKNQLEGKGNFCSSIFTEKYSIVVVSSDPPMELLPELLRWSRYFLVGNFRIQKLLGSMFSVLASVSELNEEE